MDKINTLDLKKLTKLVLKEMVEQDHSLKLLDNWKQVSTVKSGRMAGTRGYFIMKNGKLADASFEMEGSSGLGGGVDHYGFSVAVENRKLFGIPDEIADNPDDNYQEIWQYIKKSILARVCTIVRTSDTNRPNITVQIFNSINPKTALRMVQGWIGKQVPDAPENSEFFVELDYKYTSLQANSIREFLSANNPNDLRGLSEISIPQKKPSMSQKLLGISPNHRNNPILTDVNQGHKITQQFVSVIESSVKDTLKFHLKGDEKNASNANLNFAHTTQDILDLLKVWVKNIHQKYPDKLQTVYKSYGEITRHLSQISKQFNTIVGSFKTHGNYINALKEFKHLNEIVSNLKISIDEFYALAK